MIKAIIWDIDGVIIESSEIKTETFKILFADYPDKLPEIISYHQKNGGLSRYVKFRYFYENILGKNLTAQEEAELGEKFSEIALTQILKAPFVPGAIEFLSRHKSHYLFFVASGTPEDELKNILNHRELTPFFLEIHGAPKPKSDIIEDILCKYELQREEAVFIGDAESDRLAAEKTRILFIARLTRENPELKDCRWKIDDLTGLDTFLQNIYSKGAIKK